jgi:hypothetical protein
LATRRLLLLFLRFVCLKSTRRLLLIERLLVGCVEVSAIAGGAADSQEEVDGHLAKELGDGEPLVSQGAEAGGELLGDCEDLIEGEHVELQEALEVLAYVFVGADVQALGDLGDLEIETQSQALEVIEHLPLHLLGHHEVLVSLKRCWSA